MRKEKGYTRPARPYKTHEDTHHWVTWMQSPISMRVAECERFLKFFLFSVFPFLYLCFPFFSLLFLGYRERRKLKCQREVATHNHRELDQ